MRLSSNILLNNDVFNVKCVYCVLKQQNQLLCIYRWAHPECYLAVSVGNTTASHSGGQTVGEKGGAGLGTVLTDADYVTLNTYVHRRGPYSCNKDAHRSKEVWKLQLGMTNRRISIHKLDILGAC